MLKEALIMKSFLKNIRKAITNPRLVVLVLLNKESVARLFSDKLYLKIKYRLTMKKKLNLKNPQTFNEKLQCLKLYNRNPEYTKMVDKYEVRRYIADTIGEEYLIPLLGVWDSPDDIDFDSLPNQFVLKCNHNSGLGMCICKDKSKLDIEKVKKDLKKGLKQNYFVLGREWPYKGVKPRIIAEKFMADEDNLSDGDGLIDYKFYCFNGVPGYAYVSQNLDDHKRASISYITLDWEQAPFKRSDYASFKELPRKPQNLDKMLKLAEVLSKNISFLRVDFYEINGKIYFGELTFFPGGGFTELSPEEWDYRLGEMIKL